jgi:hypothetical protein
LLYVLHHHEIKQDFNIKTAGLAAASVQICMVISDQWSHMTLLGSVAKSLWFLIYAFGNIKQQPRICIDEFEKSIQVASF